MRNVKSHKGKPIRKTDFSAETVNTKKEGSNVFQDARENTVNLDYCIQ